MLQALVSEMGDGERGIRSQAPSRHATNEEGSKGLMQHSLALYVFCVSVPLFKLGHAQALQTSEHIKFKSGKERRL